MKNPVLYALCDSYSSKLQNIIAGKVNSPFLFIIPRDSAEISTK